jgi:hypothetical protein
MPVDFRTKKSVDASGRPRSRSPESPSSVKDSDLGYGEACPDSEAKAAAVSVAEKDYGYGDATDDADANADADANSGSGSHSRPVRKSSVAEGAAGAAAAAGNNDYGYGYGDASPDTSSRPRPARTSRRSSMKQGNSSVGRRASISYTGEVEVKLPFQTKPVRRRTSIAFAQEAEVREVAPVSSLTDEPQTLWFQEEELYNIKDRLRGIVSTVENGDLNTKVCIRGLEGHIGGNTQIKVHAAWDAVKGEQTMQKMEGKFNDVGISTMYKLFTGDSANQAAERAQQDAADIDKYQRDTRRMMRRLSC